VFCLPHRLLRAETPKGHSRCSNKEDNAVIGHHRRSFVRPSGFEPSSRVEEVKAKKKNNSTEKKRAYVPLSRHPPRAPSTPESRVPQSHRDITHPHRGVSSTPSSSPVSFVPTSSTSCSLAAARRSTRLEYHPRTTTRARHHQRYDDSSAILSSESTTGPSCTGASVRTTTTSTTTRASLTPLLRLSCAHSNEYEFVCVNSMMF
jgi:hypothetical protein